MTTLTAYPDPNPESTTVDGVASENGANVTWTSLVNGAGDEHFDSNNELDTAFCGADTTTDRFDKCVRGIFLFDTSSITATNVISTATFSQYVASTQTGLDSTEVVVVSSNPASNTDIVNGDYDSLGATAYGTGVAISSMTSSAYADFAFDATGIAAISKTGVTKLGLRLQWDIDDSFGGTWVSNGTTKLRGRFADQSGTSSDPKLVVEHEASDTTSTFYPDPHTETTTVDGYITSGPSTWATVRGATSGTADDTSASTGSNIQASLFSGDYYLGRGFFLFDTSSILDTDTLDSATFSQYGFSSTADADSTTFEVVQTSPASNTALVGADFDNLTFTSGGNRNLSSSSGYRDITLNATGESWVTFTGVTKLGLIIGRDLDDSAPTGLNRDNFYMSDQSGTSNDPKLTIAHSAAVEGGFTGRVIIF